MSVNLKEIASHVSLQDLVSILREDLGYELWFGSKNVQVYLYEKKTGKWSTCSKPFNAVKTPLPLFLQITEQNCTRFLKNFRDSIQLAISSYITAINV